MTEAEAANINVVRKYFAGCNSGDLGELLGTLTPDVVHYFLSPKIPAIEGAENLARYWRAYKLALDPVWSVDHVIAQGDELASEWSCIWTPRGARERILTRGSEWYVMRGSRIAEIRAYFIANDGASTELGGFPYRERGYLAQEVGS